MAYGFQTSQGSLYIVDPQGRTSRFKRSEGVGQGEWQALSHCLYLEDRYGGVYLHGPQEMARLAYETEKGGIAYFPIKDKSALPRPNKSERVSVWILKKDTEIPVRQIAASAYPQKGLWPLEEMPTADGKFQPHRGNTITEVFENAAELRAAFRKAGLTQVFLPPEYVQEWKAAGSQPPQTLPTAQNAKRDFAVQQAVSAPKAATPLPAVAPAILKARPARGFTMTK